jgi:hypothetical protein
MKTLILLLSIIRDKYRQLFVKIDIKEAKERGFSFVGNVWGDEINKLNCRSIWRDKMAMSKEEKAAYMKAYYQANREKAAAYREANKGKIANYMKIYKEANKENLEAAKKNWYQNNKERASAVNKVYREANKEKLNAYKKPLQKINFLLQDLLFKAWRIFCY